MRLSDRLRTVSDPLNIFLAQCENRPQGVTLALRSLVRRSALHWILQAELCWEVHRDAHWQKVSDREGRAYPSEEAYWEDVLEVQSWRSVARRLIIGRVLATLPETTREDVRARLCDLGITKAAILAPVLDACATDATDDASRLRSADARQRWLDFAATATPTVLQRAVSDERGAAPRGITAPGLRFRARILGAMPDFDTRQLAEEFFTLGAEVVGSDNPVAVQVAAMQECLAEWRGRRAVAP